MTNLVQLHFPQYQSSSHYANVSDRNRVGTAACKTLGRIQQCADIALALLIVGASVAAYSLGKAVLLSTAVAIPGVLLAIGLIAYHIFASRAIRIHADLYMLPSLKNLLVKLQVQDLNWISNDLLKTLTIYKKPDRPISLGYVERAKLVLAAHEQGLSVTFDDLTLASDTDSATKDYVIEQAERAAYQLFCECRERQMDTDTLNRLMHQLCLVFHPKLTQRPFIYQLNETSLILFSQKQDIDTANFDNFPNILTLPAQGRRKLIGKIHLEHPLVKKLQEHDPTVSWDNPIVDVPYKTP